MQIIITGGAVFLGVESNTDRETLGLIKFQTDPAVTRIVTWPLLKDNSLALEPGFSVEQNFGDCIHFYKIDFKQMVR